MDRIAVDFNRLSLEPVVDSRLRKHLCIFASTAGVLPFIAVASSDARNAIFIFKSNGGEIQKL
ncbi:MAG: hypothetical protein R2827_11870 [Bdellovibrionales bacterium]